MYWVPCSTLSTHTTACPHSSISIVKLLTDDTWFLGLISNNDETAYLDEVERLTSWCQDNCFLSEREQTKELIVDFRKRQQRPYTPLVISGTPVERVSSFKYLCVNISEDLTWTAHIQTQVKKARQRLYHLRQLRKFRVSPAILKTFYSWAIESVLTQCASQCGIVMPQTRTAKLCRESCAWLTAYQGLLSPLCRTSTSNAAKAELLKSSRTQITPVTIFSFCCHLASDSGAWLQKLRDWEGASSLGHQAPKLKLKLGLITIYRTQFNVYIPGTNHACTFFLLFAHSSAHPCFILVFIKSTSIR